MVSPTTPISRRPGFSVWPRIAYTILARLQFRVAFWNRATWIAGSAYHHKARSLRTASASLDACGEEDRVLQFPVKHTAKGKVTQPSGLDSAAESLSLSAGTILELSAGSAEKMAVHARIHTKTAFSSYCQTSHHCMKTLHPKMKVIRNRRKFSS